MSGWCVSFEAWENALFDEYNHERRSSDEIEADLYDELDTNININEEV